MRRVRKYRLETHRYIRARRWASRAASRRESFGPSVRSALDISGIYLKRIRSSRIWST